jgi:hypothetical protein
MLTDMEIQAIHYQQFIKETPYPDYKKKYHLAIRILKKKPKAIIQLKEKLEKLENNYGYKLPELQAIVRSTDDLNAIFPLGHTEQTKMVRVLHLQTDLGNFEDEIEDMVDEYIGGGLGL